MICCDITQPLSAEFVSFAEIDVHYLIPLISHTIPFCPQKWTDPIRFFSQQLPPSLEWPVALVALRVTLVRREREWAAAQRGAFRSSDRRTDFSRSISWWISWIDPRVIFNGTYLQKATDLYTSKHGVFKRRCSKSRIDSLDKKWHSDTVAQWLCDPWHESRLPHGMGPSWSSWQMNIHFPPAPRYIHRFDC